MNSSDLYPENHQPVEVWCDPSSLHVRLKDGRELVTPLWWYPKLIKATPAQRNSAELMLDGIHWPDLDEDLSVRGMLSGWKYPNAVRPEHEAAE